MAVKIMVIGLDGANWELIEPWIQGGDLPNINALCKDGVYADMESCLPPVTSPNWKCYSAGKNPGKLGVFWWEKIDLRNKQIYTPFSYDYKSLELWDYLDAEKIKTAIINMPTSYPPKEINGVMISGGPTAQNRDYTYPSTLQHELEQNFGYRIHPSQPITCIQDSHRNSQIVDEIYKLINLRFDVAKQFMQQNDYHLIHLTIFYINVLQHFFWNHDYTKKAWQLIDQRLSEFLDKQWNIVIISDHGSNKIIQEFCINNWLKQEGYLKLKSNGSGLLEKMGIYRERISRFLQVVPFGQLLKNSIPQSVRNYVPSIGGIFKREAMAAKIDWTRSVALASGQGPIYLTLEPDNPRYASLRSEIIEKLTSLTDPDGRKVARKVYRKEDIYSGPYLVEAPDIIIDENPGFHIAGGIGGNRIFQKPQRWIAENKREGLFIAHGSAIKSNSHIPKMRIVDIAPTLLHWMEVPIPEDMDGRVLQEIFWEESEAGKRLLNYQPTWTFQNSHQEELERGEVENRLRDLGYLD